MTLNATAEKKLKDQRAVYDFFKGKYASQEPFTQKDVAPLISWKKKTLSTYWSKQFKAFLVPAAHDTWRVGEGWRNYATFDKFKTFVTQVRVSAPSDYSLLLHDSLLIYEFFMPLTNETQLRTSLDALFYRDTVINRLKSMDAMQLQAQFPRDNNETDETYLFRLSEWISQKFLGYSISVVSGRFRVEDMVTLAEAGTMFKEGRRYLIDETTAVVRFIFPCGDPLKRPPPQATEGFDDPEPPEEVDEAAKAEAARIRWFFKSLFVRTIIQVVNAEAEIWMVESGMRNRLHIWKVDAETKVEAEEDDDESDLFANEDHEE
jgi:hypothetical protein